MRANRLRWVFLFLLVAVLRLPAQQSEADRKLLSEMRAKAERGDARSQLELGAAFARGDLGVARNAVEAVNWFRKAAEQNLAEAQYILGVFYANGEGVRKDALEAVNWFRKAAEQNLAAAQYTLGVAYANGEGVPKDAVEVVKWYRKAAEQNYAEAQYHLGNRYVRGAGVATDAVEAAKWCRKAAAQNHSEAQLKLGSSYYNGEGVGKDAMEAVNWFRKAAEQNNASAQYNLGICYANGIGVGKDEREAANWYRKAADQNDAEAQYHLGNCYVRGAGVAKDAVEAAKWCRKAAEQGNENAKSLLSKLENLKTGGEAADFREHTSSQTREAMGYERDSRRRGLLMSVAGAIALLLLLSHVLKLSRRVSELENQKLIARTEVSHSPLVLPQPTPIPPPPVVSVPELPPQTPPSPPTTSTQQKLPTQQPTVHLSPPQNLPAATLKDASQLKIGWTALITSSLILSLFYLFVIDNRFSESLKDNPAFAVGHFVVSLFLIPIGAAVGVPCWLLVRFSKRPARVSFGPFILVGMAATIALLWLGRAYANSRG